MSCEDCILIEAIRNQFPDRTLKWVELIVSREQKIDESIINIEKKASAGGKLTIRERTDLQELTDEKFSSQERVIKELLSVLGKTLYYMFTERYRDKKIGEVD